MSVTLDDIKAEQSKVAAMIAAFEAQAKFAGQFPVSVPAPQLETGEQWVCAVIEPGLRYHLILMPDEAAPADHKTQCAWGIEGGIGDLPDLTEQALIRKYLPGVLRPEAYWSKEVHKSDSASAWCTDFNDGGQYYYHRNSEFRARRVRRLIF